MESDAAGSNIVAVCSFIGDLCRGFSSSHGLTSVTCSNWRSAHRVCIELDRYCYVRIYDAEFDQYFGYADGQHWATQHWAPQPEELAKYPIDRREKLSLITDGHEHADLVSRNLSSILRAPTFAAASLISLSIRGLPPTYKSESTAAMKRLSISGAMDSREPTNATLHHLDGLDPCLCRYVTQPRLRDRPIVAPFPRTAIHFRTNMADLQSTWLPPPRPHERSNGAAAAPQPAPPARRWAEARAFDSRRGWRCLA